MKYEGLFYVDPIVKFAAWAKSIEQDNSIFTATIYYRTIVPFFLSRVAGCRSQLFINHIARHGCLQDGLDVIQ